MILGLKGWEELEVVSHDVLMFRKEGVVRRVGELCGLKHKWPYIKYFVRYKLLKHDVHLTKIAITLKRFQI